MTPFRLQPYLRQLKSFVLRTLRTNSEICTLEQDDEHPYQRFGERHRTEARLGMNPHCTIKSSLHVGDGLR